MNIEFLKYQGTGNDFIMIDNRDNSLNHYQPELIKSLCDRRFGIGADGLILLQNMNGFDFEMIYYNADGQPSSMCGNGGRCIVAYAKHLKIIDNETNFMAVDGAHYAKISEDGSWVSLQMIDVHEIVLDLDAYTLNTGSPHYVVKASDLSNKNVFENGRAIRHSETYTKEGINVNFVEDLEGGYFVRTYERGVEDETFACGTGVTAVALAMAKHEGRTGNISTPIKVLGGHLNIRFQYDGQTFTNIFLEGPATFVFKGTVKL
ncbi:MAG: diaminopimelate epimerase [Sphingobacteriales bacterium]|nr:diaminopimelate epimerase [Sphingobacteriales bacterium]